ncbi:hypothetical protein BDZ89DRAFT_1064782, partial [Hymenopellis radicata]
DSATVKKTRKIHYWYRCPYPRCTFSHKRFERFKTHIYSHSPANSNEEPHRVAVPPEAPQGPPLLEFMDLSFDVRHGHSQSHPMGTRSSMAGHRASTSSAAGPSRPRRHNDQSTSAGSSSFSQFGHIGNPSNMPQEFFLS